MYIRYIHKLYDLHLKAQNYTGTSGPPVRSVCLSAVQFFFPHPPISPSLPPSALSVFAAEASYTLLLYDELLEWSDRPLREFLNYPMQSEWQRKEYLHLTIIQNFDRGKVSPRPPCGEKQHGTRRIQSPER